MKYLGGKQRLGKHIGPVLQSLLSKHPECQYYLEPFCGALGVLRNMTNIHLPIYANDYHPDLIALFQAVQKDSIDLPLTVTESTYLHYKHHVSSPNAMKGFIGFGTSFGGRFFAGFAHKYLNGKQENFCLEAKHSLQRLQPLIDKVTFTCQDYLELTPKNAFIYCDPPYQFTKFPIKYRTDVKHYDTFDNQLFWETMRLWSQDNIVVISETHAPDDFVCIWEKKKRRTVSQSHKTRYKNTQTPTIIKEKLFVHRDLQLSE